MILRIQLGSVPLGKHLRIVAGLMTISDSLKGYWPGGPDGKRVAIAMAPARKELPYRPSVVIRPFYLLPLVGSLTAFLGLSFPEITSIEHQSVKSPLPPYLRIVELQPRVGNGCRLPHRMPREHIN